MTLTFSINQYDQDGDKFDDCILIYFNNNVILRFKSIEEYEEFVKKANNLIPEIKENL